MDTKIQQQVNKTLECMGQGPDIQVSSSFADNLSSRIAEIRISRTAGYRSRVFYPVVITVILILNIAAGFASFTGQKEVKVYKSSSLSYLANEYGVLQENYKVF